MRATFTTLFERSRYSGRRWWGLDEDDPARKQRMDQQERFAVGMIGLALDHDSEFRAHFLEGVCGLKDLSRTSGWEILVEPENWGDLVLKRRASNSFIIAEFKIGAELAAHQDPSKSLFDSPATDGQCAGYGWEIEQSALRDRWDCLKYVTVEKKASWEKVRKKHNDLECVHAEWQQLLREDLSKESKLEADVYDCPARFGIAIFFARRMKKMKLATHATQPLAILFGVLEKFGVKFRSKLLNNVNNGSPRSWLH